ncbi:MAG: hypothetical protein RMJ43_14440 [Chloroherpetonaceae bacterium]|nr:hypothetical protein [Chthonomonadaceae bacterium]MDW8209030.1 hypothetical protein [Chloroherpetonaceae bacterium]
MRRRSQQPIRVASGSTTAARGRISCCLRWNALEHTVIPLVMILMLSATSAGVWGQNTPPASPGSDASVLNLLGIQIATETRRDTEERPGTPFAEVLRGNGTRAGYLLSHGGIQVDTLSVTVGGRRLRAGRDYWVDAVNGSLWFADPVRPSESIHVFYRYVAEKDAQRRPIAVPGLQLGLGKSAQLGLLFGISPGAGYSTSTFGLSLNSKFGSGGTSAYNGLLYFSNVQQLDNLVIPQAGDGGAPAPQVATGADHLITQSLDLQGRGVRFRADYQDVGKNFAGFQTLRLNHSGNAPMIEQLNALEQERGIKRLGFGLDLGADPSGKAPRGLSLGWNRIQDGADFITRQSLSFHTNGFRAFYQQHAVGENFAAFQSLREPEKAQWALQRGLTSTGFGFHLALGASKGQGSGVLDFVGQRFSDSSGALNRNLWTLQGRGFGVSVLGRSSNRGFTRLAHLSPTDRATLALDLYRLYDPGARPEAVTPADLAQVTREAGFKREGLRADATLGKDTTVSYMRSSVAEASSGGAGTAGPQFRRDALEFRSPSLEISLIGRKADSAFGRIPDLSEVEKGYLALDIRRQYDPGARMDQVTPKEREQAGREAGLSRTLLQSQVRLGAGSALAYRNARVTAETPGDDTSDAARSVQRQSLALTTRNLQVSLSHQSIGAGFYRLGDLNDVERTYLGNERGLRRDLLEMNWNINRSTRLSLSQLGVRGTSDAIAQAIHGELAREGGDPGRAARIAGSGFEHRSLRLETTGLFLSANFASTDKEFSRAWDLALPEPVRRQIDAERGFRRTDWTGKLAIGRIGSLDTYTYQASSVGEGTGRLIYRHNVALQPNRRLSLSYLADGNLAGADSGWNGTRYRQLTLNQELGNGLALRIEQEDNATYQQGQVVQGTKTEYKRLQTAQDKPNRVLIETRRTALHNGKQEQMAHLNVHAKPSKNLSVSYDRLDIERGEEDPSETTEGYALQLNASKNFTIIAGVSEKEVANAENQDVKTITLGMQGEPVKNVTLTAKFDEVHHIGQNVRDVADISLSNTKPLSFGPVQDLTITARYAALNDRRKMQNETMTGRATWKLWKNEFVLDYGGYVLPNGSTITRLYQFTTDPDPKKWFRGSFLYKSRTLLDGQEFHIRRFTADARLSRNTHFTYTYGTLQEDERANILPVTSIDLSLKHTFAAGKDFQFFYRLSENAATRIMTRALGFNYQAQLDRFSKLGVGFSVDANDWPDRYDRSNHFRLSYERYLRADHYFNLSADFRSHDAPGLNDEILATIDFRFRF